MVQIHFGWHITSHRLVAAAEADSGSDVAVVVVVTLDCRAVWPFRHLYSAFALSRARARVREQNATDNANGANKTQNTLETERTRNEDKVLRRK